MIDGCERSYNLEGRVEFGGDLRVLQLTPGKEEMVKVRNTVFRKEDTELPITLLPTPTLPILEQLKMSSDIIEKDLGDNIHSFNFSREVFFKNTWNELNTHARGLFVDVEKEKIVARSFEKFFNVSQRKQDDILTLVKKFRGKKIKAYKKENGYLGLVSYFNNSLHFFSKSTNEGEYAENLERIWKSKNIDEDYVINYFKEHDCTLVFEVIDPVNDPHIIKYDKEDIILLDIIHNTWKFEKEKYEDVKGFAQKAGLTVKSLYKEFKDEKEFFKWYIENTNDDDLSKEDIEGVVIEAGEETSPYMTKIKFPYYNVWKQLRGVADKVKRGNQVPLSSLYLPLHNYFYAWLLKQPKEKLETNIIALRENFQKK